MKNKIDIESIIQNIKKTKKYRYTCNDTIRQLFQTGLKNTNNSKEAIKFTRKKLHEVTAFYLGDPDYGKAKNELEKAFKTSKEEKVKEACINIMQSNLSTRERLRILDKFYAKIFKITGRPDSIIDVACGLNPLSLPWMGLPKSINYFAYEIHQRRVELINSFFSMVGIRPLAKMQDVIVKYPEEEADVAFLLKMVHCFEKRQHNCTLPLLNALRTRFIVVSFPKQNISQTKNLESIYRDLFNNIIRNQSWKIEEIQFSNEQVFCIQK